MKAKTDPKVEGEQGGKAQNEPKQAQRGAEGRQGGKTTNEHKTDPKDQAQYHSLSLGLGNVLGGDMGGRRIEPWPL